MTSEYISNMLRTAFGNTIIKLLNSSDITEIMLNTDGKLWAESLNKGLFYTNKTLSTSQANAIIKLIAARKNLIINKEHPEISCELPENSARFQGFLPPITENPSFTIRKKATRIFTLDDYLQTKTISKNHASFLKNAFLARKNILICGGTASGKTTFANALLHELKTCYDRVLILEDLPELQISSPNHLKLIAPNAAESMRKIIKESLRMRPDRIVIGEVRDGSALELLKAWNTGHSGGICTIHANSAETALERLENLVYEATNTIPKNLIQNAVDIIVFIEKQQNQYSQNHEHYQHYKICDVQQLEAKKTGIFRLKKIPP